MSIELTDSALWLMLASFVFPFLAALGVWAGLRFGATLFGPITVTVDVITTKRVG